MHIVPIQSSKHVSKSHYKAPSFRYSPTTSLIQSPPHFLIQHSIHPINVIDARQDSPERQHGETSLLPFRSVPQPFITQHHPFRSVPFPFRTLPTHFSTLPQPFTTQHHPFRSVPFLSKHYQLISALCPCLSPHDIILSARFSLLSTHYLFIPALWLCLSPHNPALSARYSSLTPHNLLLSTRFPLLSVHYQLISAHWLCLSPHNPVLATRYSSLSSHNLVLPTRPPPFQHNSLPFHHTTFSLPRV